MNVRTDTGDEDSVEMDVRISMNVMKVITTVILMQIV